MGEKKNDSASYYFNSALNTIDTKIEGLENIDTAYLNHFINVINANKSTIDIENKKYDIALEFAKDFFKPDSKNVLWVLREMGDTKQIIEFYKNNKSDPLGYALEVTREEVLKLTTP